MVHLQEFAERDCLATHSQKSVEPFILDGLQNRSTSWCRFRYVKTAQTVFFYAAAF